MSKPIRILHVFRAMNRGGAETLVMNIYRHLDRSKIQFDFAVETDEECHYNEEIRSLGGRIIPHPSPSKCGILSYGKALVKTLNQYGPYVGVHSHVHYFSGYVLRISRKAGVPIRIAHSHTTHDGRVDSLNREIYRWIMQKLIYRNATHMLGCSQDACKSLFGLNCFNDSRVEVLPNAIDLTPYAMLPTNRRILREKLDLPIDVPLIGHVGRFNEVKNHRFLIEVFSELHQELPNTHLVLVGDGFLRKEMEMIVERKGLKEFVHFLGIREDIPEIMGALDIFLFTSLYEGLGIVLIEAQAAGIPCISADTVPIEADIGAGLVEFLSLNEPIKKWVNIIINKFEAVSLNWDVRKNYLRKAGYDIKDTTMRLEKLYMGVSKNES